jgi:cation diffusion facilitator CzcD-associated flavoprotein CzcO
MQVPDHPQCDPQKIRIIHVGMGAAGMLCAFKARKMLTNYELICYEKNETVGGESIPLITLITIRIIC